MRTAFYLLKIAVIFALFASLPAMLASAEPPRLHTSAKAAALIDVESGRILYHVNGDIRMRIASLTKIMTAIVAIEHGTLSDKVKVSKRAFGKEGSSLYLKLGEEMSLQDMLYGMMLQSGNDAATAVAEHVGGSEEGFVLMMNRKAELLGLEQTHFKNPHGLDEDDHYSTANDLAKLTAYALKNPVFRSIVKTEVKTAPNPNDSWDYKWRNKNKMLHMYEGADGVKTGYTKKALRCLVSSATRGGQQLAAVTLNDGDDWNDHRKMLDYGFEHFPLKDVVRKGQDIENYSYQVGQTFAYPFAEGEEERIRTQLVLAPSKSLDYRLGYRGKIVIALGGNEIGSVPVYEKDSPVMKQQRAYTVAAKGAPNPYPKPAAITDWREAFLAAVRSLLTPGNANGR